jgi:hypothetical protein
MSRLLALSLVAGLVALASGCAMCCAPFDCDYPSVPGRWVRHNPSSGRVGSAFDEAGGPAEVAMAAASSESAPPEELPAPRSPSRVAPGTRSVVPRNMGETYLPRGQ